MPVLLVRDGDETKRFEFERGKDILVGRAADNELSFPGDVKLSKKHCKLFFYEEKDCYVLSDLNSTNGTWLNQNRISTDIILTDNDKIQTGSIRILFKYDSFDSPTKTRKILKLIKKPKSGIFEQTDTLKLPKASELQQQQQQQPSAIEASKLTSGDVLNNYQISSIMHQTEHGTLYEAINMTDNSKCAIKKYIMSFAPDHPAIEDFNSTLARLNQIENPYFTQVFDHGTYQGHCFSVAELLTSQNLSEKIIQSAPYPEYDAICIIYTIGAALENAFSNYNIIHGALTPENIFIDPDNNLLISDLGIASWLKKYYARSKTLIQSEYASPEEIQGFELDWRIDLYALGIIFYQLLTGYYPFHGSNREETYDLHVNAELPHPQTLNPNIWISETSLQILYKMTAKNPDIRFSSWQEFLAAAAESYEQFDSPQPAEEDPASDSLNKVFDSYYDQS